MSSAVFDDLLGLLRELFVELLLVVSDEDELLFASFDCLLFRLDDDFDGLLLPLGVFAFGGVKW